MPFYGTQTVRHAGFNGMGSITVKNKQKTDYTKYAQKEEIMDKKTIRFFQWSVVSVFIVCIAVFISLTIFMGQKTERAIKNTTDIYMSEMNQQIQQKFRSIIRLRLDQVEGIIKRTPLDTVRTNQELLQELKKYVNHTK